MFGAIASFVLGLLGKLLSGLFAKKEPSAAALSASNATSQAQLTQEVAANVITQDASAARAADDAYRMRGDSGPGDAVDTRPDAPVNTDPNAHFRD